MTLLPTRTCGAFLLATVAVCGYSRGAEPAVNLTVQADQPGARISPTMWGVFFEDINFGADGGLYAEMVKNRSFEFPNAMMGWSNVSTGDRASIMEIHDEDPFNAANPHYLRVKVYPDCEGSMVIERGLSRHGSARRRGLYVFGADSRGGRATCLADRTGRADGRKLAEAQLAGFSKEWKKYSATLHAAATEPKAKLNIYIEGQGRRSIWTWFRCFPVKTWKNRPGGLRADMVQMLADLKPGFVRFPGGCIVEGRWLDNRYQWKNTIGDPAERKLIINRWNNEFQPPAHARLFPILRPGLFRVFPDVRGHRRRAAADTQLRHGLPVQFQRAWCRWTSWDPTSRTRLDLIEFANGPATSTWGKKRAEMGHPQPFNMKMLGIGNEQWGPQYIERYEPFAKAIKAKYPEIKLVSAAGPSPDGRTFQFGMAQAPRAQGRHRGRALLRQAELVLRQRHPLRQIRPQRARKSSWANTRPNRSIRSIRTIATTGSAHCPRRPS